MVYMHIKFFCYSTIGYGIFITLNSEFDKAVITQWSADKWSCLFIRFGKGPAWRYQGISTCRGQ